MEPFGGSPVDSRLQASSVEVSRGLLPELLAHAFFDLEKEECKGPAAGVPFGFMKVDPYIGLLRGPTKIFKGSYGSSDRATD